jgi:hypothetical protein
VHKDELCKIYSQRLKVTVFYCRQLEPTKEFSIFNVSR